MTIKEIKKSIRQLNKLKKNTQVGTEARRDINRHIRKLKNKLDNIIHCDNPEKLELIQKINTIRPYFTDLRKFTVKQLQYHYNKIKEEK